MKNYHLKSKTRLVQHMVARYLDGRYLLLKSFDAYLQDYDSDTFVLITHFLFRLVMSNKSKWSLLPYDSSAINFVLRHLRYMLMNLDSADIRQYALDNLFYEKKE